MRCTLSNLLQACNVFGIAASIRMCLEIQCLLYAGFLKDVLGIGATIYTHQESQCLPYAVFFSLLMRWRYG